MQRVASLYLPDWAIERLRRGDRRASLPDRGAPASFAPIAEAMADEHAQGCSVPRGGGWRPGARWAREERQRQIDALPTHQRPPIRELGRCDEAAANPFRAMRPDDGDAPLSLARVAAADNAAPLITALRNGNRLEIGAACPQARALGLMPGMPVAQARAQIRGLDIRPADLDGDAAELRRLAILLAWRWTPVVAIAGEDTLFLDLTGVAHIYGGEARMARRLQRMLARRGFTARIGMADTTGAAWALAHHADGPVTLCPPDGQRTALAALPIEGLRLEKPAVELLHRLGVTAIEQLAALPRAPLVRRFGALPALRLDQAFGHIAEPLTPVIPPERIAASQRFAEPIATADAIAHWLAPITHRICAELAQAGKGARRIELVADRIDGVPQRIRIGLARPSRDAAHLLRLLTRRIEDVEPGFGIDAMTLLIRRAELLGPEPVIQRIDEEAGPDVATLVDTLATRIGLDAMWRSQPVESDLPERSVMSMPLLDPVECSDSRLKPDDVGQLLRNPALHPWHPEWPKPARLLLRPERLDHVMAEMPDHAPKRFTWRGMLHRVIRADGPERISGEWWRRDAERDSVRDYFRVEDDTGRRYWLFRRGDGVRPETGDLSWYLHGCFG